MILRSERHPLAGPSPFHTKRESQSGEDTRKEILASPLARPYQSARDDLQSAFRDGLAWLLPSRVPRALREKDRSRWFGHTPMSQEQWTAVDAYFGQALLPPDPALEAARLANSQAGLPAIDVSPSQGKLLYLIALMQGARRVLEMGTLGGYSTIWMAKALPSEGVLVTLEADPKHAGVAQQNIERAGFGPIVRILVGEALQSLPKVKADYRQPFDLIFIDADKANAPEYFRWALELSRRGTVVIVDNVVRKGEILNSETTDPNTQGMRRLTEMLAREPRVAATAIQTVGTKGYDGLIIARVL